MDVELFGLWLRAADGQHLQGAYFGDDVDEAGIEVAGKAWFLFVLLPVVLVGYLEEFSLELG